MTSHPGASAGPARQLTGAHRLDLADPGTLQQLRDLQRAAYAVEAGLIGFDGIPPLHETLAELRGCGEAFLGVCDEAGLAGAVSWTRRHDGTLDICRLAIHPRAHRRGIATTLLDTLDAGEPADLTVVSTGTANRPALALYQWRGFLPARQRQIAPGVTITLLGARPKRRQNDQRPASPDSCPRAPGQSLRRRPGQACLLQRRRRCGDQDRSGGGVDAEAVMPVPQNGTGLASQLGTGPWPASATTSWPPRPACHGVP